MKIVLTNDVFSQLETVGNETCGKEFSGFGYVNRFEDRLEVDKFVLLHVGSEVLTEIGEKAILKLQEDPDYSRMKLWVHRHPMGTGVPGKANWSGIDNKTIQECPLGGLPQAVRWSASIVRTPRGWVGRLDNHIKGTTLHVPVEPNVNVELLATAQQLYIAQIEREEEYAVSVLAERLAHRLVDIALLDDLEWDDLLDTSYQPRGFGAAMRGFPIEWKTPAFQDEELKDLTEAELAELAAYVDAKGPEFVEPDELSDPADTYGPPMHKAKSSLRHSEPSPYSVYMEMPE